MIQLSTRLSAQISNRAEDVALIQQSLAMLKNRQFRPYYEGRLDGRFGPKTSAAVAAFQSDNNITDDRRGEVSPRQQTVREIEQKLRSVPGADPDALYTGLEEGLTYFESPTNLNDELFEIRPNGVPADAIPIVDEDAGAVIGFRSNWQGVTKVFDLDGSLVSIDEVGLQSPVVDPIDLITFGGVVAVSIRKALQLIGRAASLHASGEGVGILLKEEALRRLRSAFTSSPKVQFKLTQKTLKHMRNPDRHVPVHILRLAIRHGRRSPDPRNVPGLYMYRITMRRVGKNYELEVLIRESDNTVMHFEYNG